MSILFALAAAVGFGSSDFAAGHASRRSSAVSVVILTHFASFLALLAVSVFPGQGGSPTIADIGWGLAAGLGGGFGAMFLFRGLGKGSMAVVAPITAAGAATIPVVAGLLQGEAISIFGVFGVSLALVAIVMISLCADEATEDSTHDAEAGDVAPEPVASFVVAAPWAPPVGPPVAAAAARVAPEHRFAPVFAPPVVGPASVLAASTPLAAPVPVARPLPAPVASGRALPVPVPNSSPAMAAPQPATPPSFMPPPLRHHSIIDSAPAPAPAAGVALLDMATVPDDLSSLPPLPPLPSPLEPIGLPTPPPPPPPPPVPAVVSASPVVVPVVLAPVARAASATPASTMVDTNQRPRAFAAARSVLRRPGIIDALLSGVGFGLFFVFIARTAETAGQWPLASARGISAAMFFVGALVARGAVLPEKGSRRAVILAGVLDAIAAVFFVLSTRAGLLSVGAVLASLYPAATIVLARFISHERIGRRQLVGLMLAGLAVSLLAI